MSKPEWSLGMRALFEALVPPQEVLVRPPKEAEAREAAFVSSSSSSGSFFPEVFVPVLPAAGGGLNPMLVIVPPLGGCLQCLPIRFFLRQPRVEQTQPLADFFGMHNNLPIL